MRASKCSGATRSLRRTAWPDICTHGIILFHVPLFRWYIRIRACDSSQFLGIHVSWALDNCSNAKVGDFENLVGAVKQKILRFKIPELNKYMALVHPNKSLPVCYTKRMYVRDSTQNLFEETENLKLIVEMAFCNFGKHVSSWHILHNFTPFTVLNHV